MLPFNRAYRRREKKTFTQIYLHPYPVTMSSYFQYHGLPRIEFHVF